MNEIISAIMELRDVQRQCEPCQGLGVRTYGDTATWRGGSGGQTLTSDVCNRCWGSGDADRPWPSRRAMESARADSMRLDWLEGADMAMRTGDLTHGRAFWHVQRAYEKPGEAPTLRGAIDAAANKAK